MTELSLKLPISIYNQLHVAAGRENISVNDLLVELISQRFPSTSLFQAMPVKNGPKGSSDYQFVADWALPEFFNRKAGK